MLKQSPKQPRRENGDPRNRCTRMSGIEQHQVQLTLLASRETEAQEGEETPLVTSWFLRFKWEGEASMEDLFL